MFDIFSNNDFAISSDTRCKFNILTLFVLNIHKNDVIFKLTSRICLKFCSECEKLNLKMLSIKYVFL